MEPLCGTVASLFLGDTGTLSKAAQSSLEFAFDGIVGDRHRGLTRKAWEQTDKQPGGTERRNERQWSAVAQEDLDKVSQALSLSKPLSAGDVAVNLGISGVPDFSRLPRGTTFTFERGVDEPKFDFIPTPFLLQESMIMTDKKVLKISEYSIPVLRKELSIDKIAALA